MIEKIKKWLRRLKGQFYRPIKTPTILQMEATECGAISLSIILAYYGCYLQPEEARLACDISRDGSKAINIINAARDYGMEANGYNISSLEDLNDVVMPCIAHWEFNHFLVLEQIIDDDVFINDPATGPRIISRETLDKSLTGVIMELTPGPDFQKKGKPELTTIAMLKSWLKGNEISFVFILLLTFFLVIPNIAIPVFTKIFIDDILIDAQKNWLMPLLLGMFFTAIMRALLTWAQQHYILYFQTKLKIVATTKFVSHLLRLPMNFFQQRSAGDIADRLYATDEVSTLIATKMTESIVGLLAMFLYTIVMFIFSPALTLLILFITLINFLILFVVQRKVIDLGRRNSQDFGKLSGVEMNSIQIMETIKSNALENYFFQRWASYFATAMNSSQRMEIYTVGLQIVLPFLKNLSTLILLCLGGYFITQGKLTVGTLIAFQSLLISFSDPLDKIVGFINDLQTVKGKLVRLNDVNNSKVENILGSSRNKQALTKEDVLRVENVTFGYSRAEAPLFMDFSLILAANSSIAVVGPSGSGKSTLAKMVCGLYQPWSGEIFFGARKLNEISRASLAKHVAVVDQTIILFAGTVKDNLTLWNASIPDAALWEALQIVDMEDIIVERGGLNSLIAENGGNFSGGQRQRLEIARALVANPEVLILDEATAALDPIVEKNIYDHLKQKNYTLLIIAHRLSAVRDSDQIIVVNQGMIMQQGKHDELIAQAGLYRDLALAEIEQDAT